MKKLSFGLIVGLGCLFSCDSEPEKEYFKEVPPPTLNGVTIALTGNEGDTILVLASQKFSVTKYIGNRKPLGANLKLDGKPIPLYNDGTFNIDTYDYPDGYYVLDLVIATTSGSGSLSDKLEGEVQTFQRKWVVHIDTSAPPAISFVEIKPVNGLLEMRWEQYPKSDFGRYGVTKYCYNVQYQWYQVCWTKKLSRREMTTLRDSTFMTGKVKYAIWVEQTVTGKSGSPTQKEYELLYDPALKAEWVNSTDVKLTWRKAPLSGNFDSYSVALGNSADANAEIKTVSDTVFVYKPKTLFGGQASLSMAVHPARPLDMGAKEPVAATTFVKGNPFPKFVWSHLEYNAVLNKYFGAQKNGTGVDFVRLDAAYHIEQVFHMTSSYEFALSENGKYLYVSNYDIDGFSRLDPLTFEVLGDYKFRDIDTPPSGAFLGRAMTVSNNNRLTLKNTYGCYVMNMDDFSKIESFSPDYYSDIIISPEGDKMFYGGKLYTWNGTHFVPTGYSNNSYPFQFLGNDRFLFRRTGAVDVINLVSLVTERSFAVNADYFRYDPQSELLTFGAVQSTADVLYLYRLDQDAPVSVIPIADINRGNDEIVMPLNNALISSKGFVLPLSDYYRP